MGEVCGMSCGVSGTEGSYSGLYEPRIVAPVLHVMGNWDNMVHKRLTLYLFGAHRNGFLITHDRGHCVPAGRDLLLSDAAFC